MLWIIKWTDGTYYGPFHSRRAAVDYIYDSGATILEREHIRIISLHLPSNR
jgi:hypothetical protein